MQRSYSLCQHFSALNVSLKSGPAQQNVSSCWSPSEKLFSIHLCFVFFFFFFQFVSSPVWTKACSRLKFFSPGSWLGHFYLLCLSSRERLSCRGHLSLTVSAGESRLWPCFFASVLQPTLRSRYCLIKNHLLTLLTIKTAQEN